MSEKRKAADLGGGIQAAAGEKEQRRPHTSTKTQRRQIPNLQAALEYARLGWWVIPLHHIVDEAGHCSCGCTDPTCSSRGKHPRIGWRAKNGGVAFPFPDEATVKGWWEKWPNANVGVLCGPSGLLVLDADGDDGKESAAKYKIPPTPTQQTPNGFQWVFRHPGGEIPNSVKDIAPGFDIRADGGLVVVPPSNHYSGEPRLWLVSPQDADPTPAPTWLSELIATAKKSAESEGAAIVGARIPDGERNDTLYRHACRLRNTGMEENEIGPAVHVMNKTRCEPPLPDGEVDRLIESACTFEPGTIELHQTPPPVEEDTLVGPVTSGNGRNGIGSAVIVMPDNAPMPPLPEIARLPEGLGTDASPWLDSYIEFSRLWSPRGFDDFHEACALWLLSTVAARRVMLHFGGERFTNLYVALAARTSIYAKTTTAKIAHQTLQSAELDWMLAADDSTPQAFIRGLSSRLPSDFDDLPPHYQDKISKRFALRGARGWAYEEFGEKLAAMSRDGGFMADFKGHLRRFDDCPQRYEYATIGRGHDLVERPYLALLANMTPADMKPLSRRGASMWGDGFWARFAFVTPTTHERKRGRFPSGERVIPTGIVDRVRNWHERLGLPDVSILGDKGAEGEGMPALFVGEHDPTPCTLGAGVVDAFYNYGAGLLDLIQDGGNTDLDGNYSRFAEKALRVAILLASLENDDKIEMRHWARAQEIAERWRGGLHALYDQVTEADTTADEQMEEKVLKFVARLGSPTACEVARNIRGIDTGGVARVFDVLADNGVLVKAKSARSFRYSLPTNGDLTVDK